MNNLTAHRRRLAAQLLLAVFLPMLLLASLHHHDLSVRAQETTCYACQHHVHHNGHLVANPQHTCSCVLCHFLTLPYLPSSAVVTPKPCSSQHACTTRCINWIVIRPQLVQLGRAPPVVRC
ncbi:MAG: hypothetical protein PUF63_06120 [Prevotella sp.]|nr:hypothetical protein [Prevotella sp.]